MRPFLIAAAIVGFTFGEAAAGPKPTPSKAAPTAPVAAEAAAPQAADVARYVLGRLPGRTPVFACFERTYDPQHLTRHPQQKVGSMLLLVRGETVPEDPVPNYAFALGLTYKDRPSRFVSSGYCGHASDSAGGARLTCGIDCDGGSLDLGFATDAKSTLLSLERIAIWPANSAADDDEHRAHLDAGADDKAFRLQRTALPRCLRLAKDDEETAALR